MYLLYCSDPMDSKSVDMDYREEYEAARSFGFETGLVSFDDVIESFGTSALMVKDFVKSRKHDWLEA